ncbi:MAG: hypothetical protein RIB60_00700 [Phycisphaerales bacterium]
MKTAVFLCACIAAPSAGAGAVLFDEHREVTAFASAGTSVDAPAPIVATPGAPFNALLAANATGGGAAGSVSFQDSAFFFDRISARGQAAATISSAGAPVSAAASSVFEVSMILDADALVTLSASGSDEAQIALFEVGGTTLFSGTGTESFTLLAGTEYRLTASVAVSLESGGTTSTAFFVDLVGIPAPGSATLLAPAMALAARRRR